MPKLDLQVFGREKARLAGVRHKEQNDKTHNQFEINASAVKAAPKTIQNQRVSRENRKLRRAAARITYIFRRFSYETRNCHR